MISESICLHILVTDQKIVDYDKGRETYELLVVIFSSVSLPEGSFSIVTEANMGELEVTSSNDVEVLKPPVIAEFDVLM